MSKTPSNPGEQETDDFPQEREKEISQCIADLKKCCEAYKAHLDEAYTKHIYPKYRPLGEIQSKRGAVQALQFILDDAEKATTTNEKFRLLLLFQTTCKEKEKVLLARREPFLGMSTRFLKVIAIALGIVTAGIGLAIAAGVSYASVGRTAFWETSANRFLKDSARINNKHLPKK